MAMNKKEKQQLKDLLERCQAAEAKASKLGDLGMLLFELVEKDVRELVEQEVEDRVSDLDVSIS